MPIVDVGEQVETFVLSFALGAIICFVYDFIRALHKTLLKGFTEVLVTDILFWLSFAILTYLFLIIRCSGIVRGYVLCGLFLGFIALRITVSRYVLKFFSFFLKILVAILHFVSDKLRLILLSFDKYLKKVVFAVKKVLHNLIKVMYNQFKSRCSAVRKGKGELNGDGN